MTKTFSHPETLVLVDGFIYGIDKEIWRSPKKYAITHDREGQPYLLNPERFNDGNEFTVILTSNPSLKDIPQLPELVQDEIYSAFRENYPIEKATSSEVNEAFIRGYKAASKKQYTEEDMENAFYAGREMDGKVFSERQHIYHDFNQYLQSLPKPVPKSIAVDIDKENNVTILSITW